METMTIETTEISEKEAKRIARLEADALKKEEIAERRDASTPKIIGVNDLLFPVEIIDNPVITNSEYSKIVLGDTIDGKMALNYCSPRYELVPNEEIFPNIEQVLLANGIEFEVVYTHISHVRFYADYKITDKRFGYTMKGTTDTIQPMIRVQHSYNGKTKYRIMFGYFRLVCSNGLVIPLEEMSKFNLVIVGKHTEAIKHSFDRLNTMLNVFTSDATNIIGEITHKYEMLGGSIVTNVQDRITEVLAASKIIAVDNKNFNTVNDITNRIQLEANREGLGYNGKVTDWLVYNGINQYMNDNDRNIIVPEKRAEYDSKVIEYMLQG